MISCCTHFYRRSLALLLFFMLMASIHSQNGLPWEDRSFSPAKDSTTLLSAENFGVPPEGNLSEHEYIVGPGDRFFISILGIEEITYSPKVNYENTIYIPNIGGISLLGLSLHDAKLKIDSLVKTNFRQVKTYVSLSEIRKIKINIAGNVKNPGGLVLFANSRLSDIISSGKFLEQTADIRNIKITSFSGQNNVYDLLSFLRLGVYGQNPYLREGDFIYIPKFDKHVTVNGSVQYPGVYEFKEGENLAEIIAIAGGISSDARRDSIELIRFDNTKVEQNSIYLDIKNSDLNNITLHDRDRILVREDPTIYEEHIVLIEGYVRYPGYYKIKKNVTTLSDIISLSGGLLPGASMVDASLYRSIGKSDYDPEFERLKLIPRADMTEDEYDYFKSKARERRGRLVVDFVSLIEKGEKSEDVYLEKNDKISIPLKKNYITLIGQVVNPGKLEFKKGYTVSDYIALAGGFGWRALDSEVRVVKSSSGEWLDADDVDELFPGDIIWVPEDPPAPPFWTIFMDTLMVLGQVATVVAATVAVVVSVR